MDQKWSNLTKVVDALVERFNEIITINEEAEPTADRIQVAGTYILDKKTYHPDNCLFTEHRQFMWYAFASGGSYALAEYLYRYCKQRFDRGDNGFKYFVEDRASKEPALQFLIETMHPEVVSGLILGTLGYQFATDEKMETRLNRDHKLTNTIGIYLNQHYSSGHHQRADTQPLSSPTSSQQVNKRGTAFSPLQLKTLLSKIDLYIRDLDYAKEIDRSIRTGTTKNKMDYVANPLARRYSPNKNSEKVIRGFQQTIKRLILNPSDKEDTSLQSIPMLRGLSSVGFGVKCGDRANDHEFNKATSSLFGLINAIINNTWPKEFLLLQIQLLYICDPNHKNLAEALCSVLASSYHDYGGLNGQRAGGLSSAISEDEKQGANENVDRILCDSKFNHKSWERSQQYNQLKLARMDGIFEIEEADPIMDFYNRVSGELWELEPSIRECMESVEEILLAAKLEELYDRKSALPESEQETMALMKKWKHVLREPAEAESYDSMFNRQRG